MPPGYAFVALRTLIALFEVADCSTDFMMRLALYQFAVATCRVVGIRLMRRPRSFWTFMIWMLMSSRLDSERSAAGLRALENVPPVALTCAVETNAAPSHVVKYVVTKALL